MVLNFEISIIMFFFKLLKINFYIIKKKVEIYKFIDIK